MKTMFHSVTTTLRHREHGNCDPSDFGVVELKELSKDEKELIVSFKDGDNKKEFINHNERVFERITSRSYLGSLSNEKTTEIIKKQGYFSEKTALKLVLEVRKNAERRTTSHIRDYYFILIGKTLYIDVCELGDLQIGVRETQKLKV